MTNMNISGDTANGNKINIIILIILVVVQWYVYYVANAKTNKMKR